MMRLLNGINNIINAMLHGDLRYQKVAETEAAREPEKDTELGNEDTLPALFKISDDYGFSKLELRYKLSSSEFKKSEEKFHSLKIPIKGSSRDHLRDWYKVSTA